MLNCNDNFGENVNRITNKEAHQITTLLFDVGGVLLTDFIETKVINLAEKYHVNSEILLKAKHKYRPLADKGQISDVDFWRRVLETVEVNATEIDCNFDSYMQEIPGGLEIARKAKRCGYKIAILSNDTKEMSEQRRLKYGFDALFEKVIISCFYGVIKPDPKIYEIAMQELCVNPIHCIFIDDREENVQAGQDKGIHSILFKNSVQASNQLKKIGIALA
jgi:putative hydrolase of the HAD superfamily